MSAVGQTSPLRDAHKDLTRTRILEAAIDLLKDEELEALKLADIAAKAGVTERTLYRHFATRDDLLKAMWPRLQARAGSPGFPKNPADFADQPLWLFPNFDKEGGAVRASLFSRAGRELRRASNNERQKAILANVRAARPELKEGEAKRLAAVVHVIGSAYGWAIMKEAWDLDGEEAGRAAAEATRALLNMPAAAPAKAKGKKP
ncbi:MAG TPA: helix-turn-helix domain-containing protein [Vitreimonas sp.]|jgi:AcrR family transcriptional regulator|nr:helix-turn-helix domain-containing protein [Vitreimonas sp.]